MDKYDIILNAEQQFAREVTLGVIVTRPLTAWHYLIPGFFIIDFLRRGSAIRQYTKHFMFPRKLAIDAAAEMASENLDSVRTDPVDSIRVWLESLNLNTSALVQAHVELIDILAEHYLKLLTAEGDSFNLLIEHAYQKWDNFEAFVKNITSAENEVDRQVIKKLGGSEKVKEKVFAEQQQIAKRRQKILGEVF